MRDIRIAYLQITTWADSAITFGTHYYGTLILDKKEFEVETILTEYEASELNKAEDFAIIPMPKEFRAKKGDTSTRFISKPKLIEESIKLLKEKGENFDALAEAGGYEIGPFKILYAKNNDMMEKANTLWKKYDELECGLSTQEYLYSNELKNISREWEELVYGKGGYENRLKEIE